MISFISNGLVIKSTAPKFKASSSLSFSPVMTIIGIFIYLSFFFISFNTVNPSINGIFKSSNIKEIGLVVFFKTSKASIPLLATKTSYLSLIISFNISWFIYSSSTIKIYLFNSLIILDFIIATFIIV